MKKNTLTLLSSLSLTVMLAACGGGGSSTASSTGSTPAETGSTSTPSTNTGTTETGTTTGSTTGETSTGTGTGTTATTPSTPDTGTTTGSTGESGTGTSTPATNPSTPTTGTTGETSTPNQDTLAIPAAWDGMWTSPEPCSPSYARTDSSGDYYDAGSMFIINSADQTLTFKEIAYTDDKCTSKAGAIEFSLDASQFKQTSFDGYQNARTGVITVSNVKIGPDGDGSGFSLNPEPISKGAQTNQSFGINASGQLCGASSNGDLKVTPNMAEAVCGDRQK